MSMMHSTIRIISLFTCALFLALPINTAQAGDDGTNVNIIAAEGESADIDNATTHGPIRLTMDKSELIRLDQSAASIIVGNPLHINVLAESSKLLVVIPRVPGATHMSVLNKEGEIIMQRHVIVASPKEKYVRVRKSCAGSEDENCQATQTYYCPDMCHEIAPYQSEESDGDSTAGAAAESGADIGSNNAEQSQSEE